MNLSEEYRKRLIVLSGLLKEHSLTDISNMPDDIKMPVDQEISIGLLSTWANRNVTDVLVYRGRNKNGIILLSLAETPEEINDATITKKWIAVTPEGKIETVDGGDSIDNENEFIAFAESLKDLDFFQKYI